MDCGMFFGRLLLPRRKRHQAWPRPYLDDESSSTLIYVNHEIGGEVNEPHSP